MLTVKKKKKLATIFPYYFKTSLIHSAKSFFLPEKLSLKFLSKVKNKN